MSKSMNGFVSLTAVAAVTLGFHSAWAAERFVAVDGSGDGTSAESPMASLAEAYAQAAEDATKDAPGIVRLASGMYRLSSAIEMKPYVKVVGDTEGPTIISGDNRSTNARAAFWSKNLCDSVYVSKPGIAKTPVWNDDLTFNEPNPDNLEAWYCTWYGNSPCNAGNGFVSTDGNAEDNLFENLTFTLFRYGAFKLKGGSLGTLTLRNCKFVGDCCNALTDGVSAVGVENGSVDIDHCEFVGCAGCVRLAGSGTSRIDSSTFRENCFRSLVEAQGTHRFSISNCVFKRNWQSNSQRAIVNSSSATLGNRVVDSVFTNNFFTGGSYGAVYFTGQTNQVLRCNFTGNKGLDFFYAYSASLQKQLSGPANCGIGPNGKLDEIRDCSFVGNELSLSSANAMNAALCNLSTASGTHIYFNCTFAENVVTSDGTGVATLFHRANGDLYLVHCIIYGNSYAGTSKNTYPLYSSYAGGNQPATYFCNSVFEEPGFAGSPIAFLKPGNGAPTLLASVVKDFDASKFTYASIADSIVDSSTGTAKVNPTYLVTADGRKFLQLSFESAFRKIGYPIYADAAGLKWLYLPRSDKWYRMNNWSLNFKPSDIVLDQSVLVADAFGDARLYGKVALGPLNAEKAGLLLYFK